MSLHRPRRPYSKPYAARQLASVRQALASTRALEVGANWRRAASKAESCRRLEALERKWMNVLEPRPVEVYVLPF